MEKISVVSSPLPFSNLRVNGLSRPGQTLLEIVDEQVPEKYLGLVAVVVTINGEVIPETHWRSVRPKLGALVNVMVMPQGGRGKNPLATILSIMVMVAAPYIGAAALTAAAPMGAGIITTAVGVGGFTITATGLGSVIGLMLVSALAPPPKQSGGGVGASESPTLFIEGARNSINPFGAVPVCLGKNRMFPLQAAKPFTETQNNEQYVRQLFTYGFGQSMVVSDFKIGDTPLSNFTDFQTQHFLSGNLHVGGGLYANSVNQVNHNVLLTQVDGFTVRTVPPNSNEVIIDYQFTRGLASFFNKKGVKVAASVQIQIEYSVTGADTWVGTTNLTTTASSIEAVVRSHRIVFPSAGNYDIRIRRVTADTNNDRISDLVYLTAIKGIRYTAPVNLQGLCGTAVRIKATDQLNGALEQLNAIVSNVIPDYDADGDIWSPAETSNPASIYRYVLQGAANARQLPDDKVDIEKLEEWHAYCKERGYTCDIVVDYNSSVDEILRLVASAGAASPSIVDGKWSVAIDKPKDDIVQMVTPRNSWGYSGEMIYPRMPHAFRVTFRNSEKGYLQDERIVYADGYDEGNATLFEELELRFCTSSSLAYKTARRFLATAILRPETHTFMMDVENLVCIRGDRIKFEHDVPLIGVGDGRIKDIEIIGDDVISITLDDVISIPFSGTYYVRIRLGDGTQLYKQISVSVGQTQQLVFTTPFPVAESPSVGDLCYVTQSGGELDLIVNRIEPMDDLSARITCLNYAPEIFEAETGPIPPYNSNITVPLEFIRPSPPVLIGEQSDEEVMLRNIDGTFTSRAVFTLQNLNEGQVSVDVKVRKTGDTVFTSANILHADPERVMLTGMDDGLRYDIWIRYRRASSSVFSLPLQINNYLFIGSSGIPSDVTGFVISVSESVAMFKWNENPEIDISHYVIKFSGVFSGATWDTAQILDAEIRQNSITLPFQPGTYLIKAVDYGDRESANATAIITFNPGNLWNAVAVLQEQPDFSGYHDGTVSVGNSLQLATGINDGYYYFANDIDLGEVYTSYLSSVLVAGGAKRISDVFSWEDVFAITDVFTDDDDDDDVFGFDDVFAVPDIFGIGNDGWEIRLEMRFTNDDPNSTSSDWTDWMPFTVGNHEFRSAQFRVYLNSIVINVTPVVLRLEVNIDMPDRIERGEDMEVTPSGVVVEHMPPFLGDPAVAVTIQDGAADDRVEFIEKNAERFEIMVYNETAAGYVTRTFDYIASGYGRKN